YQSRHYVPKTALVTIEIARAESDAPPRMVEGRVAWVQRPRTVRELFQIGVEFTAPGNVWGIAFPPADWFPLPNEASEQTIEIPVPPVAVTPVEKKKDERAAPVPTAATKEIEPAPSAPEKVAAPAAASESKVRVLPTPPVAHPAPSAHETMSAARQMARLLAEAKQHLRRTMQTGAAEAVAQEVRTARESVAEHVKTTVNKEIEDSVTKATERSVQAAVQTAVESSLQQLVERATQQVVQNALAAFEKARESAAPKAEELDSQVRAAVERVVEDSAAKLAEQTIQQSVQQTVEQAVKQSVQQAVERATATLPAAQPAAIAPNEETLRKLDEAANERLANWRKEIENAAGELQEKSLQRLSTESESTTQKWRTEFDTALQSASEQMSAQLNQISQAATARAEEEIQSRRASLQTLMNEAAAEAQKNLEALCAGLDERQARAESAANKADEVVRRAEETSAQIEAMSRATFDDAQRKMNDLFVTQASELDRRADELLKKKAGELEKPIQDIADEKMRRLAEQVEHQLAPHYQRAQEASDQLASAGKQAQDVVEAFRAQMHDVSEKALETSMERMKHQVVELPSDFEEKCRAALVKVEEELEQKTTEASHSTFEALYKASEWYQKKAQTNMQGALEKMLEQSSGTMREHAAELSRMFASELDHCSRSYVEHAQGLIEESAKDVKERTREQLSLTAQTTAASAIDELSRIAQESLTHFEQITQATTEQARAGVNQKSQEAMAEFNTMLERRLVESAAEMRKSLNDQLQPLIDEFHTKRDAEQDAWLQRMKGTVDHSIEQYKERLENASNSWLLASATTLGQHSKGVLDTLSNAAEERLRNTCADVFANLGDTLRDRLLGISSDVSNDKDKKPTEKK
ncbi:MAG TPA: hypothetical protein VKB26_15360, partial [Candidatus Acidoferrales bacterium]|nr:hypothetical protein [Candidatus Acidoferrales bacterium]